MGHAQENLQQLHQRFSWPYWSKILKKKLSFFFFFQKTPTYDSENYAKRKWHTTYK